MSDGAAQCGFTCPHARDIETLYEKVIAGNGELPIAERVRKLEDEVSFALPILNDLKTAADRQDGRDAERLDAELRRDKSWANFRRNLTLIVIVVGLILTILEFRRNIKLGNITIPKIFQSQSTDSALSSRQQAGDEPAWVTDSK